MAYGKSKSMKGGYGGGRRGAKQSMHESIPKDITSGLKRVNTGCC